MKLSINKNCSCFTRKEFILSVLIIISLITAAITPLSAFSPTDSRNQVVVSGEGDTLYYNQNGTIATTSNYEVSVNKIVSQSLDSAGEPIENQFEVIMIVESTKDYSSDTSVDEVLDTLSSCFQIIDGSISAGGHPSEHNGTISWPLAGVPPNTGIKIVNGKTMYNYVMNYQVVINNLKLNYESIIKVQSLNDSAPTLLFSVGTSNQEVAFNIPSVKTWVYYKLLQKAVRKYPIGYESLTGAVFDVYADIEPEGITEDTIPFRTNITDDLYGEGLFSVPLPSGHTYILKETKAPKGYQLAETPWKFDIRFGNEKRGSKSIKNGGLPVVADVIYNEKKPEKRDIKVTKRWIDSSDTSIEHPSVEFSLYYESEKVTKTAFGTMTLPAGSSDGDFITFDDVPTMDTDLNFYTYSIKETIENGEESYRLFSTVPTDDGFVITNQYVTQPRYGLRINRTYEYFANGELHTSQTIVGNETDQTSFIEKRAFQKDINTNDYTMFDGKAYSFLNGSIDVGEITPSANFLVSGNNTIQVDQANKDCVVTLRYQLFDMMNNDDSEVPPSDATIEEPGDTTHPETGTQDSSGYYFSLVVLSGIGLLYLLLPEVRKQYFIR